MVLRINRSLASSAAVVALTTTVSARPTFAAEAPDAREVRTEQIRPTLLAQELTLPSSTGTILRQDQQMPRTFNPIAAGRIILQDGNTYNVFQHLDSQDRMRTFVHLQNDRQNAFLEVSNPEGRINNNVIHTVLLAIGEPMTPPDFIRMILSRPTPNPPGRAREISRPRANTQPSNRAYQPSLSELCNHVTLGHTQAHINGYDYIIDACHRDRHGNTYLTLRSISHANSPEHPGHPEYVVFNKHGQYFRIDEHGTLRQLVENYHDHFKLSNPPRQHRRHSLLNQNSGGRPTTLLPGAVIGQAPPPATLTNLTSQPPLS